MVTVRCHCLQDRSDGRDVRCRSHDGVGVGEKMNMTSGWCWAGQGYGKGFLWTVEEDYQPPLLWVKRYSPTVGKKLL